MSFISSQRNLMRDALLRGCVVAAPTSTAITGGGGMMLGRTTVGAISSSFPSSSCKCAACTGGEGGPTDLISRAFSSSKRAFSSLESIGASKEIDLNDSRRKGLAWRAKQRGWLELDWLVGTFAQKYLANLSDSQLDRFEEILELDNPDLFNWLSGQEPAPQNVLDNEVYQIMAEYVNAEHPDIMKKMEGDNQNLPK